MAKEEKNSYVLQDGKTGDVQIANDVIAVIAGIAATEVDGVDSMAGNISNELVSKLGVKNLSKGVTILCQDGSVVVDLSLNIKYGYSVADVTRKVQERVKTMIENMTGLHVTDVNIKVAGVAIGKDE